MRPIDAARRIKSLGTYYFHERKSDINLASMAPVYRVKPTTRGSRVARVTTVKQYSSAARGNAMYARRRQGYSSVARTRGAAVQGEMKYFDCDANSIALVATTTTWPAGTMVDPLTTINLGSAAVANPLCLYAPTVGAALNQRIGRKILVHKIKGHRHVINSTRNHLLRCTGRCCSCRHPYKGENHACAGLSNKCCSNDWCSAH